MGNTSTLINNIKPSGFCMYHQV